MGRARIFFACAHSGLTRMEGRQESKTAAVILFLIVRATSDVLLVVFPCLWLLPILFLRNSVDFLL